VMTPDVSYARGRAGPPPRSVRSRRAVRLACALAIGLVGCAEEPGSPPTAKPSASPSIGRYRGLSRRMSLIGMADSISTLSKDPTPFRFADIREESGIDFVHVSGATDEKHFPTQNGSGVALFDHDGDGRLDVYLASFNPMPPGTSPT